MSRLKLGDDPPYLTVGTEVSAKYKGAFCEAKIRKVVRIVKCRVNFKSGLGSALLSDDQVKGSLRVGSTVEAKHQEKNQYFEATISKIQDCSQYTVVFDDGDITTLRRSALCLKSGRHFNESETLDQLPLTHPEHFSNPVVGGRRGFRKRQNEDDKEVESSDEEEVQTRKGIRKNFLEADVGKVVCVETTDKKKAKDPWFPALVVSPSAQETVKIKTKEDYLVRSFRDGRYYTVPKKETTIFTKESYSKLESSSNYFKSSLDKAICYIEKDELPPHWDRDVLFGSADSCEEDVSDSDYEDDNREEKDRFVAELFKFMDERASPINKVPVVCNKDLDLYRLYKIVTGKGGYNKVTSATQWKPVTIKMGLGSMPSTATINNIKLSYKRYLFDFEEFDRKLGCTMKTTVPKSRYSRSIFRERLGSTSSLSAKELRNSDDFETTSTISSSSKKEDDMEKGSRCSNDDEDMRDSVSITSDADSKKGDAQDTRRSRSRQKETPHSNEKKEREKSDTSDRSTEPRLEKNKRGTVKSKEKEKNTNEKKAERASSATPKVSKHKGTKKTKEKITEEKDNGRNKVKESLPSFCVGSDVKLSIGDRLLVYYPKAEGKVTYEAKVVDISENESSFYVHYTGWNTRYDEWIKRDRISEVIIPKPGETLNAGRIQGKGPIIIGKGNGKVKVTSHKTHKVKSDKGKELNISSRSSKEKDVKGVTVAFPRHSAGTRSKSGVIKRKRFSSETEVDFPLKRRKTRKKDSESDVEKTRIPESKKSHTTSSKVSSSVSKLTKHSREKKTAEKPMSQRDSSCDSKVQETDKNDKKQSKCEKSEKQLIMHPSSMQQKSDLKPEDEKDLDIYEFNEDVSSPDSTPLKSFFVKSNEKEEDLPTVTCALGTESKNDSMCTEMDEAPHGSKVTLLIDGNGSSNFPKVDDKEDSIPSGDSAMEGEPDLVTFEVEGLFSDQSQKSKSLDSDSVVQTSQTELSVENTTFEDCQLFAGNEYEDNDHKAPPPILTAQTKIEKDEPENCICASIDSNALHSNEPELKEIPTPLSPKKEIEFSTIEAPIKIDISDVENNSTDSAETLKIHNEASTSLSFVTTDNEVNIILPELESRKESPDPAIEKTEAGTLKARKIFKTKRESTPKSGNVKKRRIMSPTDVRKSLDLNPIKTEDSKLPKVPLDFVEKNAINESECDEEAPVKSFAALEKEETACTSDENNEPIERPSLSFSASYEEFLDFTISPISEENNAETLEPKSPEIIQFDFQEPVRSPEVVTHSNEIKEEKTFDDEPESSTNLSDNIYPESPNSFSYLKPDAFVDEEVRKDVKAEDLYCGEVFSSPLHDSYDPENDEAAEKPVAAETQITENKIESEDVKESHSEAECENSELSFISDVEATEHESTAFSSATDMQGDPVTEVKLEIEEKDQSNVSKPSGDCYSEGSEKKESKFDIDPNENLEKTELSMTAQYSQETVNALDLENLKSDETMDMDDDDGLFDELSNKNEPGKDDVSDLEDLDQDLSSQEEHMLHLEAKEESSLDKPYPKDNGYKEKSNDRAEMDVLNDEDESCGSLLCEETIPGSPPREEDVESYDEDGPSKYSMKETDYQSDRAGSSLMPHKHYERKSYLSVARKYSMSKAESESSSSCAPESYDNEGYSKNSTKQLSFEGSLRKKHRLSKSQPLLPPPQRVPSYSISQQFGVGDNTPPTTPESSSLSSSGGSPRGDSGRISPILEQGSSKSKDYSDNDSGEAIKSSERFSMAYLDENDSEVGRSPRYSTHDGGPRDRSSSLSTYSPLTKRRRAIRRNKSPEDLYCYAPKVRYTSSGRKVTSSVRLDDSQESFKCTTSSAITMPPVDLNDPPLCKKFNFIPDLDASWDSDRRIEVLMQALSDLRDKYHEVKSEMASFERKRKRTKRKEKEKEKALKQQQEPANKASSS